MNMIKNVVVCRVVDRNKLKLDKKNVMVGQNWGFVSLGLMCSVPIDELCEIFLKHFLHSCNSRGIGVKSCHFERIDTHFFGSFQKFVRILVKTTLKRV
jgi:hypothetical protein